ncbi:MAG: hypothetical protein LBD21_11830 [Tannerellaceae bacterium]|jgi:hypothetical protein|nr:hypothetical protein [Tannerellaceae bacterium]
MSLKFVSNNANYKPFIVWQRELIAVRKINPAKKQGLSFTIPTGFLYNPLWGMGKPISVGAFHLGGSASRFRLKLSTLGDPSADFG